MQSATTGTLGASLINVPGTILE